MKVQEFLTYCEKRNLSKLTVRNYRQHLKDFYIFLQGRKDMDEVTSSDLLEFISEQAETVSARSVNIKMASLRVYFDFLCRFHGLQLNPTLAIAKCKEEVPLANATAYLQPTFSTIICSMVLILAPTVDIQLVS